MPDTTVHQRLAAGTALLLTGVMAGAFFYGWAVEAPTFARVPLDVHLIYRVELMSGNGAVMPALGILSSLALVWTAVVHRSAARRWAAGAAALSVAAQLTTRFGNVPINGEIRQWAAGAVPPDFAERLKTWWLFHDLRVAMALAALVMAIVAVDRVRRGSGTAGGALWKGRTARV